MCEYCRLRQQDSELVLRYLVAPQRPDTEMWTSSKRRNRMCEIMVGNRASR